MRVRTVPPQLVTVSDGNLDYYVGTTEHGYGTSPVSSTPQSRYAPYSSKRSEDEVAPGFERRIAAGEIINHPCFMRTIEDIPGRAGSYQHIFYETNNVKCYLHGNGSTYVYHNKYHKFVGPYIAGSRPPFLDVSIFQSEVDALIARAFTEAKANIDESEMLALTTVAEAGKTVESMRNILWRVLSIARKVRKLDLLGLSKELSPKELANRYMEARYALRPLIIDAVNLKKALEKDRQHVRRTARSTVTESLTYEKTLLNRSLAWLAVADWKQSLTATVTARGGVLCDMNVTAMSPFGVTQLAESMWELVPFSFIVDWFANVGDTIAAHTPNAGVRERASWVTVNILYTATNTVTASRSVAEGYAGKTKAVSLSYSGFTEQRKTKVYQRFVDPDLSMFPGFLLNLDMYKLTDLGIILRNVFR